MIGGTRRNSPLMSVDCAISYYTLGTVASMVDRGRLLGQLTSELLSICQPTEYGKAGLHAISQRGPWARECSGYQPVAVAGRQRQRIRALPMELRARQDGASGTQSER